MFFSIVILFPGLSFYKNMCSGASPFDPNISFHGLPPQNPPASNLLGFRATSVAC